MVTNNIWKYVELEPTALYGMACVAQLIMWFKLGYWFRLFSATSFYVRLITETVADISTFMIMLSTCIFAFANCLYILNLWRLEQPEPAPLFDEALDSDVLNALLNQYMLALGEFQTENFSDQPNSGLVWVLFIAATFITQITILNMLIAIMGDTFGKVTEVKEQSGLREKIKILADYVWILSMDTAQVRYIYAMKPRSMTEEEGASWEGTVTTLKKAIEANMKDQKAVFTKKIAAVEVEVKHSGTAMKILEEKVNGLQGLAQKQLTIMQDIQRDVKKLHDDKKEEDKKEGE